MSSVVILLVAVPVTAILNRPVAADEESPVMRIPAFQWPTPTATQTAIPMQSATATLAPAVVHPPTVTPTPTPATRPVSLTLAGKRIDVEASWTEPETLAGETYNRWQVPDDTAGHHTDTPAFGKTGNVIIGGHSTWYGALKVFAPILRLEVGDLVIGENADGTTYTYRVTSRREAGYEDNDWLAQSDDEKLLTLYTCNLHLTGLVLVRGELVD